MLAVAGGRLLFPPSSSSSSSSGFLSFLNSSSSSCIPPVSFYSSLPSYKSPTKEILWKIPEKGKVILNFKGSSVDSFKKRKGNYNSGVSGHLLTYKLRQGGKRERKRQREFGTTLWLSWINVNSVWARRLGFQFPRKFKVMHFCS